MPSKSTNRYSFIYLVADPLLEGLSVIGREVRCEACPKQRANIMNERYDWRSAYHRFHCSGKTRCAREHRNEFDDEGSFSTMAEHRLFLRAEGTEGQSVSKARECRWPDCADGRMFQNTCCSNALRCLRRSVAWIPVFLYSAVSLGLLSRCEVQDCFHGSPRSEPRAWKRTLQ